MKADARGLTRTAAVPHPLSRAWMTLARLPQRVTERQFWIVQVTIALAAGAHYVAELSGITSPFETVHGLSVMVFVIPMLYASLTYGWEGAVLTALWGMLLLTPSMWIYHRSELHWLTEATQLLVTLPIGMLVAWRVDKETRLRRQAESTSTRLDLLNRVAQVLRHTLEVDRHTPSLLRMLREHLGMDAAWIVLAPAEEDSEPILVVGAPEVATTELQALALSLHQRLEREHLSRAVAQECAALPLLGESRLEGSLGWSASRGSELTPDDEDLIATVANQVAVALENARLTRQRQESLQSYVRQVTQAQEDERLRIARDLHDDIAQELINIIRRIDTLSESDPQSGPAELLDIAALTRKTLRSVRDFARNLRPSTLDDLGLVAAIESVVSESNVRPDQHFVLDVRGTERRCDPALELALFRITQEALRNAEKHSGAANVTVTLDFGEDLVTAEIADDGIGFELPARLHDNVSSGRLGLLGVRERAQLVGATFEIVSSPGKGTTVRVGARRLR